MSDTNDFSPKEAENGVWSEKVVIITDDYEISGLVFLPKTGKRERFISNVLNAKRKFIAVKDYELRFINSSIKPIEKGKFLHVNVKSIIILKPALK